MNRLLAVAALALVAAGSGVDAKPGDKYTTRYDNVNLDDILGNDRLFKKYMECMLADDDKHCTPDGKELRKTIPDALQDDCSKCNEKQKEGAEKVIRFLIENHEDTWKELEKKFDPEGKYRERYEERAKELDIAL